jgi:hypothetical protein
MPHSAPLVNTRCSYSASKAPRLAGRELLEQEEGARPVARKVLVAAGIVELALHQRLRLRQRIGQQQVVVPGRSCALAHGEEFDRHTSVPWCSIWK